MPSPFPLPPSPDYDSEGFAADSDYLQRLRTASVLDFHDHGHRALDLLEQRYTELANDTPNNKPPTT